MIENFLSAFNETVIRMIGEGIIDSFYMVLVSTLFAYIIGLPLGMILILTDSNGMLPLKPLNAVLNFIVNVLRSVPFLILAVFMIPYTRALVGTAIGPTATVVALVVAAAPFVARMVEQSLQEVDYGVIEAAHSMGVSPFRILVRVMLPEAAPSLIVGATIATTTILGYSAMAGMLGAGGLGDIALRYGYQRYQTEIMIVVLVLLVVIVQLIQAVGMFIAKKIDKRNIG